MTKAIEWIQVRGDSMVQDGTYPKTGTRSVFAPCQCCDDWSSYPVDDTASFKRTARMGGFVYGGLRSDDWHFHLQPAGSGYLIIAGCRRFRSFKDARKHWFRTRGQTPLGDETFKILDAMEREARRRKFIKTSARP
jgi:hypothetical protein